MTPTTADLAAVARALDLLEAGLADPEWIGQLDPALVQRLNAVAVRAYAGQAMTVGAPPAFGSSGTAGTPTASDVCFTVTQMLGAVSVEVFELAMWQSWSSMESAAPDSPGPGGPG
jgi:hypothetical protein